MRWRQLSILLGTAVALAGCGGTKLLTRTESQTVTLGVPSQAPQAVSKLGFPTAATRNTTRVPGADPISDAAGVALAVYPSVEAGTHPAAVTLAPTDDWQAALASAVLMAPPIRAPILLSGSGSMPPVTADTLSSLSPTGSGSINGSQLIRVGDVPSVKGVRTASIKGNDPYSLAAAVDKFQSAAAGRPSSDVVIASANSPAYAMPAAGWAAESGNPILFVAPSTIPSVTAQALKAHPHPHIYVLGPASVISDSVLNQLRKYGPVKRVGANDPADNSVAFAEYRDPSCAFGQPCAHIPGSFGWAIRSPGHGYVMINASRTLDAAAAAPLSGTGDFGPQLLVDNPNALPHGVLQFFLNYATPGYTQEGPTAAVYNHGWMIGDQRAITTQVQAEIDSLLQAVPQTTR